MSGNFSRVKLKSFQIFGAAFMLFLLTISIMTVMSVVKASRNEHIRLSSKQMITAAYALEVFNNQIDKDITMFATDPIFSQALGSITSYKDNASETRMTPSINGGKEQEIYESLKRYGESHSGTLYAYIGTQDGGYIEWPETDAIAFYDPTERPWYQEAILNDGQIVHTAPYQHARTKELITSNTRSIKDASGQVIGVVGIDVKQPFMQDMLKRAQDDDVYYMIVYPDGTIIADGNNSYNAMKNIRDLKVDGLDALLTSSDSSFFVNMDGEKFLVSAYHSDKASLIFASFIPDEVFLTSAYKSLRSIVLFSGVVVVAVGYLLGLYLRSKNESLNALYFDKQTGFHSRNLIVEMFDKQLKKADNQRPIAIALIDIVDLKLINHNYGYDTADKMIEIIASELKAIDDLDVSFGRLSYTELMLIFTKYNCIEDVVNQIQLYLQVIGKNREIDDKFIFSNGYAGISEYPTHGLNSSVLMRCANAALEKAAEDKQNKFKVYDETLSEELEEKFAFQRSVRNAVNNKEWFLVYQPIYSVDQGRIEGFEALIRWQSKNYGFVNPEKLIATVEHLGLIVDIGYEIFTRACVFCKETNEYTDYPISVFVNVSSIQLLSEGFSERLNEITKKVGVSNTQIGLELTETILISSIDKGLAKIDELRDLGFKIALDDFGVGYSSLSYFNEFNIDTLKIDKTFIWKLDNDPHSHKLVELIISLSKQKNMKIVAEGVETPSQLSNLKSLGCDYIQGYLISKPVNEQDIRELFKKV